MDIKRLSRLKPRRRLAIVGIMLCGPFASTLASDADEIKQRLNANQSQSAYQFAMDRSDESAGDPDFDFWFGMAAVAAGDYSRAVFAFERVLISQSDNHRARLELARALFADRDYLAAKGEFETVLAQSLPENVRARVNEFLVEIAKRLSALRWQHQAIVGVTVGTDSNINAATDNETVTVPALSQVVLSTTSREMDDQFVEWDAQGQVVYRQSKKLSWFTAASLRHRNNVHSGLFDPTSALLRVGGGYAMANDVLRFPVQIHQLNVDGSQYRRMVAPGVEWARTQHGQQYSVAFQGGSLRYPNDKDHDADMWLLNFTWVNPSVIKETLLNASVFYGDEDTKNNAGGHYARVYYGARMGLQRDVTATMSAHGAVTVQQVEHAARDPTFNSIQQSEFYQAVTGIKWHLDKSWTANAQFEVVRNDSNIALYDYNRTQLSAGVEYAW